MLRCSRKKSLLKTLIKTLIKLLFILVLVYAAGRFVVVYYDSRLTGNRAPYIQMSTTNSVVIHWLTDKNQSSIVRYGEDKSNLDMMVSDDVGVTNHIVKLSKLKPGTRYFYQAEGFRIVVPGIGSGN